MQGESGRTMPDNSENPDDINPPSTRESLPLSASQAGEDGGASPGRDLANRTFQDMMDVDDREDEDGFQTFLQNAHVLAAESRAELEGSTEDGKSALYVEGRFRFVTPCHASKEGLRASQICTTCFGDLKRPVETAIMLSCGHWTTADFATGERRRMCQVPGCEEWSLIKAERVAITRYDVRPISVTEQLAFTEEQ
jgi:hypothetical protein